MQAERIIFYKLWKKPQLMLNLQAVLIIMGFLLWNVRIINYYLIWERKSLNKTSTKNEH